MICSQSCLKKGQTRIERSIKKSKTDRWSTFRAATTAAQALEQHGMVDVSKAALRSSEMSKVGLPSSAAL